MSGAEFGTDGAAAPGDCAAASAESCGGLTPAKFYDSGAGECVAVAACDAPAVLNAGTNRCDCPAPNVGTDGAAAPGDCAAPSAESCGGLSPAKFYDSAAGACVAVAACVAPAVLNAGTNLCDCPPPNFGTDGADAPGDCAAPGTGQDPCTFADVAHTFKAGEHAQVSLQIDNCNAKGWGTKKVKGFSSTGRCYCDIGTTDIRTGLTACGSGIGQSPDNICIINSGAASSELNCTYYFGATLQHLPPRTEENKDSCFVTHCQNGQEPSGFNMNGETECACPAGEVFQNGTCAACPDGQFVQGGACIAASVESCGGVTPAQGYDSTAGACVACIAGQSVYNGACVCPVGQVVLNNACAACGDGEIVYRGVCADASVLELSGKALTLYNLIAGSISDLDDGSFRSNALKEFQQGILDRHNGVANYIGNLNDFYTGTRQGGGAYGEFLVLSQTAGFGDY